MVADRTQNKAKRCTSDVGVFSFKKNENENENGLLRSSFVEKRSDSRLEGADYFITNVINSAAESYARLRTYGPGALGLCPCDLKPFFKAHPGRALPWA